MGYGIRDHESRIPYLFYYLNKNPVLIFQTL